jgi:hypothetical protein
MKAVTTSFRTGMTLSVAFLSLSAATSKAAITISVGPGVSPAGFLPTEPIWRDSHADWRRGSHRLGR